MNNDIVISELQKMNNAINTKDSLTINCVVKSTEPIYDVPQPRTLLPGRKYRSAVVDFSSDNYFENINVVLQNNNFFYSVDKGTTWKTIKFQNGYYDIDEYQNKIFEQMIVNGDYDKTDINNPKPYIKFSVSLSIYKSIIEITNENYSVNFNQNGTFRENLGFEKVVLMKGKHISPKRMQITHIKRVNVHCDLITGGYDNQGKKSDIILSFPTGEFEPGRVVALRPNVPIYLLVVKEVIDRITFKLTDQNGNVIKSEGEGLSFCIHIETV
jgi:hypothetical protein